jgi:hypothetical protein
MKKWLFVALALFAIGLTGCSATIYGVPQDRWNAMGEQERVAAMEAYQARQAALERRREEQARQQALERERQRAIEERQRAIEAQEARDRQLRLKAIYRGEGLYGDLLLVTLQDGRMKLHGSHEPYRPVAFRIAAGDSREIQVVDLRGRKANMAVSYDGGTLLLDDDPGARRSRAAHLIFDEGWERGKTYAGLNGEGPLGLHEVTVTIKILGEPPRDRRAGWRPRVVVIQKPVGHPGNIPETGTEAVGSPTPRSGHAVIDKDSPREGRKETGERETSTTKQPGDHPPARVKITFAKGQILIKGKLCPLTPQSMNLREGDVRTVALKGHLGKVKVRITYRKGEIAIDDQPGKGKSDTRLGFKKEWRDGFTYRLPATEGRVIEDLEISVLAI